MNAYYNINLGQVSLIHLLLQGRTVNLRDFKIQAFWQICHPFQRSGQAAGSQHGDRIVGRPCLVASNVNSPTMITSKKLLNIEKGRIALYLTTIRIEVHFFCRTLQKFKTLGGIVMPITIR